MCEVEVEQLASKLGIGPKHLDLFRQSLTHKSYLGEADESGSNERLEFLGDSILGMIVSEYLFGKFLNKQEGELAKAKAVAVSEPILAEAAARVGLSEALLLSSGEASSGGRARSSILADAFEAIVAAIYLSLGLEPTRKFVLEALEPILGDIERGEHHRNFKSDLQELSQQMYKKAPKYVVIGSAGADHDRTFIVQAQLNGEVLGVGTGKSKKQAEQAAALEALHHPTFAARPGSEE